MSIGATNTSSFCQCEMLEENAINQCEAGAGMKLSKVKVVLFSFVMVENSSKQDIIDKETRGYSSRQLQVRRLSVCWLAE